MQLNNAFTFYAQTMPGLEQITWREIQRATPNARVVGFRQYRQQNGLVIFENRDDPSPLLRLRTPEDVFYLADHAGKIAGGRAALQWLSQRMAKARYFDVGLQFHRRVRQRRHRGRTRFRVVARIQGKGHSYRRADIKRAVEKGVLNRYNQKWSSAEDAADLEIWATLLEREFLCGIRLSDRTMRHRSYKTVHKPASLRPSVAAAMVLLSEPEQDDLFVDPMCGAGTILAERALVGPYRGIVGGDLIGSAVATGRANLGLLPGDIEVRQWNAESLPLDDLSVDKVVVNLPFGKRLGSHRNNRSLYRQVFAEISRVLRSGGRLVALTGERRLVSQVLAAEASLVLGETWNLSLLGTPASIYVVDKQGIG
ncbi:MAG: RNA methyltransferase [Dehalococcoidia bacterium]|nr:RNA methyltransferase [Dehalococcoidia bacterium]